MTTTLRVGSLYICMQFYTFAMLFGLRNGDEVVLFNIKIK